MPVITSCSAHRASLKRACAAGQLATDNLEHAAIHDECPSFGAKG